MDPKLLSEDGWKVTAQRSRVRDNGLQRALANYESLEEDAHDDRLKALASVIQLGSALKKAKEVAALPDVVKYLINLLTVAAFQQRENTKAKADAQKTQTLAAKAEAKKRELEEGEEGESGEDNEEEEAGDYRENLLTAFKRLKGSKEIEYNFIVCDAKPQCGVVITKQRINSKHKAELTKITGGSKCFLKEGKCRVDGGKLVFDMENAPSGLAAKLKKSFKYFTGLTVGILVGDQSDEDEEEQLSTDMPAQPDARPLQGPAAREAQAGEEEQEREDLAPEEQEGDPIVQPEPVEEQAQRASRAEAPPSAAARPERPTLASAPDVWNQTQQAISTSIDELKTAIRKQFVDDGPDLVAEIDQQMEKLDGILDTLDDKLAKSLAKAHAAENPAARTTELKNAKTILMNYIKYVKGEPMIGYIDSNPFGVQVNLKTRLTASLTHMAQAIGR